ncbi:HEAT repeat domain-containing protein [Streptomyces sp. PLK6-54]|uniref:HEAT repeat domain-containing protein n=1 Tax=Actinacidiphila acidipaludis TaxID=2873382 RepID=A0ABS7Q1C9_9ACTN|nr:HEAT repeat domain-containing protein [Streptomyces acidipaludis]
MRHLLTQLRAVVTTGPSAARGAALDALSAAPARLLLLLDRHARPGPPVTGAPGPLHLFLDALDARGRTRQAAVEGLAGCGGPLAAAALALRTDDWTPEVRRRAAAALMVRSAPDEVAAAVRVLLRLEGRSRAGGLLADYRTALGSAPHRRAVRALAADADPPARRFGVELALDLGDYVPGDLLRAALYDGDQVCRRLCAQRLLELDPAQAGRLLTAKGAGVRELAVAALPADVPAKHLVPLLADRARMVRVQARWTLYQRGEPPVEVYRAQLRKALKAGGAAPRLVAGLAVGLGECGDASDAGLLAGLLGSPHPQVRRAAARGVARLAALGELVALLGPLANDPDAVVAREAFEGLGRVPHDVPPETLWIGRTRTEPAVRRLAERIGARRSARVAEPYAAQSGQTPR